MSEAALIDEGLPVPAKGDIIHMDVDVTGGSSPTIDGVWAEIDVVRE